MKASIAIYITVDVRHLEHLRSIAMVCKGTRDEVPGTVAPVAMRSDVGHVVPMRG